MTNFIKVSQQGFDVNTAGDEDLIFSSQWPLLKIYQQGSFTISDVTQDQVIATHDLGFPPMFIIFNNYSEAGDTDLLSTYPSAQRSEYFNQYISVNNSQLVWHQQQFNSQTGQLTGYYYIYALDLTAQYIAPVNNVGGLPASTSSNRNFKIAKSGKSIKSNNLSDFVIHSDTRSPLIQAVVPGTVQADSTAPAGNSLTVYHGLTYIPMFFGYTVSRGDVDFNPKGNYCMLPTGTGGSNVFSADTQKVQFVESSAGRVMTIIILKDPFLVSASVQVNI